MFNPIKSYGCQGEKYVDGCNWLCHIVKKLGWFTY